MAHINAQQLLNCHAMVGVCCIFCDVMPLGLFVLCDWWLLHVCRHDQLLALLTAGADPAAADYDGRTPLHIAASLGETRRRVDCASDCPYKCKPHSCMTVCLRSGTLLLSYIALPNCEVLIKCTRHTYPPFPLPILCVPVFPAVTAATAALQVTLVL